MSRSLFYYYYLKRFSHTQSALSSSSKISYETCVWFHSPFYKYRVRVRADGLMACLMWVSCLIIEGATMRNKVSNWLLSSLKYALNRALSNRSSWIKLWNAPYCCRPRFMSCTHKREGSSISSSLSSNAKTRANFLILDIVTDTVA